MHFEGIDYSALKASLCREFGVGLSKEAANTEPKLLFKGAILEDLATKKWSLTGKGGALIGGGAALAGLGMLGTAIANQYNEKTQPLYKQLADPNSGLGSTARTAAGIGGAMLAASLLNEATRNRHSSTLI